MPQDIQKRQDDHFPVQGDSRTRQLSSHSLEVFAAIFNLSEHQILVSFILNARAEISSRSPASALSPVARHDPPITDMAMI